MRPHGQMFVGTTSHSNINVNYVNNRNLTGGTFSFTLMGLGVGISTSGSFASRANAATVNFRR